MGQLNCHQSQIKSLRQSVAALTSNLQRHSHSARIYCGAYLQLKFHHTMPQQSPLSLTASAANLRWLAMIRLILMIGLLVALGLAYRATPEAPAHPAHLSILVFFALLNIATYWRLQQPWPVTDLEYFCQLLIDVASLTVLLYFSGGANNPFISYYLVPLTISAAILPWRFTWIIAGLSLIAYSLMLFYYQSLPEFQPQASNTHNHHGGDDSVSLHILGMWMTFVLSTCLITYFVVKMATALRRQEQRLVANREDALRDEQILAVATLAAGTAHELGTPLSTMMVILDDLAQDNEQQHPDLHADLLLLKGQVESCKHILQGLVSTAEAHSHGQKTSVLITDYLPQILTRWHLLRPNVDYQLSLDASLVDAHLDVDTTLEQAIDNLLNNAADASVHIDIDAQRREHQAVISIRDQGPGIALDVAEDLGKPFVTNKGKGLGLGLFLTHATIDRYGGQIALFSHPQGGTVAELTLPISHTGAGQ